MVQVKFTAGVLLSTVLSIGAFAFGGIFALNQMSDNTKTRPRLSLMPSVSQPTQERHVNLDQSKTLAITQTQSMNFRGGYLRPDPDPVDPEFTRLDNLSEASRFLIQAGFGGSLDEIQALVGTDATDWVEAEFNKPATSFLDPILTYYNTNGFVPWNMHSELYWQALIEDDDVLRQRMINALSQIFVISDHQINDSQLSTSYFQDVLSRHAFGNYRDLLQDVTYSPAMADFLTYLRNRKGDPDKGRVPDENYAREILQLFTIGLVELNMDGTPKAFGPVQPNRVSTAEGTTETYDNEDIRGLARVFTGLTFFETDFWATAGDSYAKPLVMYEGQHSELEKTFLGTTIPAGTPGDESISMALDTIFEHPNVPPFVARQLIQRFTSSSPEPIYVRRVANAFANGTYTAKNGTTFGDGRRGDLKATLAAILLDDSIHDAAYITDTQSGKLREPVIKFIHWNRAFRVDVGQLDDEWRISNTSSPADRLSQHPFRSPSVFNFYRPGYSAPGSESAAAGMTTPEFQIVNEGSGLGYVNFMTSFILDRTGGDDNPARFTPNYAIELAKSDRPAALVNHLDLILTGRQMNGTEKTEIMNILEALPIEDEDDLRARVHVAIVLITSLSSYAVIK